MRWTNARTVRLAAFELLCLAFVLALWLPPASAHEHFHAGDLEFTVGWGTEPPIVYQANSITVEVERTLPNDTVVPVEGVAANLTVTLSTGPASAVKAVEPSFGAPGAYELAIVPTRAGAHHIMITGTIDGNTFNVSGEIEAVQAGLDVDFPVSDPTLKELNDNATAQQAQIAALQAQVASLQSGSGPSQAEFTAVQSQASTAMVVGVVGALAGLVGVGLALSAMRAGKRAPPS